MNNKLARLQDKDVLQALSASRCIEQGRHHVVGFVMVIVNFQNAQLFVDRVDQADIIGEFLDRRRYCEFCDLGIGGDFVDNVLVFDDGCAIGFGCWFSRSVFEVLGSSLRASGALVAIGVILRYGRVDSKSPVVATRKNWKILPTSHKTPAIPGIVFRPET